MKESNLTFAEGFSSSNYDSAKSKGATQMAFDWDKAAKIIKEALKSDKNLIAEAGLQGDWEYTGGVIFKKGKPVSDSYTYLSSNWANPTLSIEYSNGFEKEFDCFVKQGENGRFDEDSKWDEESLEILDIPLDTKLLN